MTWVRFDDQYPIHRKVGPLTDRLYRLANEAIFWASRNTTDGRIGASELTLIRPKATPKDADELVRRGIWHAAGNECPHTDCPPSGADGWVIHDYWDFQPSAGDVAKDRAGKAERQRRWRERKANGTYAANASRNGAVDASRNGGGDALRDALVTPAPSRPAPKGRRAGLRPALAPDASPAPASPAAEHAEPKDHKPVAAKPPDLAELRARIDTAARSMRADRQPGQPPDHRPDSLAELRRATDPEDAP